MQTPTVTGWNKLLPELLERIAERIPPNDAACNLRLVCTATAAALRGSRYQTIHLSQPVPRHAFARHWGAPEAMQCLTREQRTKLLCLIATSGDLANLRFAVSSAGLPLTEQVALAAAAAGRLHVCRWLADQRVLLHKTVKALQLAAEGGHARLVEWLLVRGCTVREEDVLAAARGGHVGLMKQLLRHLGRPPPARGLVDVAQGCALSTLQRFHDAWLGGGKGGGTGTRGGRSHTPLAEGYRMPEWVLPGSRYYAGALAAAAGSATCDWRAKVEWLEGTGYDRATNAAVCESAAAQPDARERLVWLMARGYPADSEAVLRAAWRGDVAALEVLLTPAVVAPAAAASEPVHGRAAAEGSTGAERGAGGSGGKGPGVQPDERAARLAASEGHVPVLEALLRFAEGCGGGGAGAGGESDAPLMDPDDLLRIAASHGRMEVAAWVVENEGRMRISVAAAEVQEAQGQEQGQEQKQGNSSLVFDADLFRVAAQSGCVEMLAWLRGRGCPWHAGAYAQAAGAGSVPALEWLAERGCPMPVDGEPYTQAIQLGPDMFALRCLRRLGCSWGPRGSVFTFAVGAYDLPDRCGRVPLLRWLLEAGCPVDWEAAVTMAAERPCKDVLEWVHVHRR